MGSRAWGVGERAGARVRHAVRTPAALVALAAVVGVGAGSGAVVHRTEAAFTGVTGSTAAWTAATVAFDGGSVGSAVLDLTGLRPGDTGARCLTVRYTGTATPVTVRLHTADATDPEGLGPHVALRVSQVADPGTTPCASMTGTVVYDGTLAGLTSTATSYESGRGSWVVASSPAAMTYRFAYTVGAEPPQASTARLDLVWEART